jgi:hypothetical protein
MAEALVKIAVEVFDPAEVRLRQCDVEVEVVDDIVRDVDITSRQSYSPGPQLAIACRQNFLWPWNRRRL